MVARTPLLLALALATAAALAGCTNDAGDNDPAPEPQQPPAAPEPRAPEPQPAPAPPAPAPQDYALAENGEIRGTFDRTWDIVVANVAFREAGLRFALDGLQPGSPPTARVHLTLYDPNGAPVQTGIVGVGAPSNEIAWAFSPGQLPLAGTYQLRATSAADTPLPSGGFATWMLDAHVDY